MPASPRATGPVSAARRRARPRCRAWPARAPGTPPGGRRCTPPPGRAARRGGCSRCTPPRGSGHVRRPGPERDHAHRPREVVDLRRRRRPPRTRRRAAPGRSRRRATTAAGGARRSAPGWVPSASSPGRRRGAAPARPGATASPMASATASIAPSGVAITTRSAPRDDLGRGAGVRAVAAHRGAHARCVDGPSRDADDPPAGGGQRTGHRAAGATRADQRQRRPGSGTTRAGPRRLRRREGDRRGLAAGPAGPAGSGREGPDRFREDAMLPAPAARPPSPRRARGERRIEVVQRREHEGPLEHAGVRDGEHRVLGRVSRRSRARRRRASGAPSGPRAPGPRPLPRLRRPRAGRGRQVGLDREHGVEEVVLHRTPDRDRSRTPATPPTTSHARARRRGGRPPAAGTRAGRRGSSRSRGTRRVRPARSAP